MTLPRIAAVATATPRHGFRQAELLEVAGYLDSRRRSFFLHSDIETRRLYVDAGRLRLTETVDELADRAGRGVLELGGQAARTAIARAGWTPTDVDFLATATCTARLTPSLDARLVRQLGCRVDIQRVHVGDTGCAAAMVALQQAWNHLRAFPDHRALVVAAEICSAAYYLDDRLESAVAHAIFADGAGALAVSTTTDGPAILAHRTIIRPEHLQTLGFEYPNGRMRVVLSESVRRLGGAVMQEMAETLLADQGLKLHDIRYWILHSAGRRVLDGAQRLIGLDATALRHSRAVLRRFGNMSSATIVFVLEDVLHRERPVTGDWGIMIGLGPGYAAEGAILQW